MAAKKRHAREGGLQIVSGKREREKEREHFPSGRRFHWKESERVPASHLIRIESESRGRTSFSLLSCPFLSRFLPSSFSLYTTGQTIPWKPAAVRLRKRGLRLPLAESLGSPPVRRIPCTVIPYGRIAVVHCCVDRYTYDELPVATHLHPPGGELVPTVTRLVLDALGALRGL